MIPPPGFRRLRPAALAACLVLVLAPGARAQSLPDIGSSAGELLTPAQQQEYGEMTLAQLRNMDYTLDDPLLNDWLQALGNRMGTASDKPEQRFTVFLLKDREINAFATLGGYVAVNAGLILAAEDEGELASVLGHEFAHVTQQHVLRAVEAAKKDSLPILLAMLGAIAVAQGSNSSSASNGAMAALVSAQGLMIQRQINYTRSGESEADRLGIRTLYRAGFDPDDMAKMFQRMLALSRSNQGGERERTPDYLLTHPVTTSRISESIQRADQLRASGAGAVTSTIGGSDNPLLPGNFSIKASGGGDDGQFAWAQERLRALTADTPAQAIREYEQMARAGALDDAQQYGLAVAKIRAGKGPAAMDDLAQLLARHPGNLWLELGSAQAGAHGNDRAAADARFDALVARLPNNLAVARTYAAVLNERGTPDAGRRAQAVLRPLLNANADDPGLQAEFARASDMAGDPIRAGEAYAEAAYLNGRPEQALVQLNTLKKRPDLDYYARARIDARIAAITPVVLELQRQGIRDQDLHRQ
ncbi:MAG: M48 family metalloprotease [Thermomonas sp.]